MTPTLQPCVFFDRDGIVNVSPPKAEYYVLSVDRFFLIPQFVEALGVAAARGYAAVIVTNQKCVARGLITMAGIDAIHAHLRGLLQQAGLALTDIYVCPHGDEHPDRKPNPGMLLRAAHDHRLDLARSWMIGDHERDIRAGRAAGCARTILVHPGPRNPLADFQLSGMPDLPDFLKKELPPA
ncbi:MAG: HAD family hydrolase [Lentisphaerae bacterium]|nr:HAD family hydrolase [Lentisphaerota bacterium]